MNHIDTIAKLMRQRNITQDDLIPVLAPLSKSGKITRGAIGHYFTKRSNLSLPQIEAISSYLGVSLASLLNYRSELNIKLLEQSINLVNEHNLKSKQKSKLIAYIYAELSSGEIITKDKVAELVKLL